MLKDMLRIAVRSLGGPAARRRCLIARSGLFDASYYLINGADVLAAGADPLQHFCEHGWRENRRPNLYFDSGWYRARYGDAMVNPLLHYIRCGESEGCRPIPFFDPRWYARTYRLPRGASPLAHYLAHRRSQRFAPSPMFDVAFYLARHGAEIGPNRDPFMHLLRHGAAGRDLDPSASFDSAGYRRVAMVGDTRRWTGLIQHEMRVPLVHHLDAEMPPRRLPGRIDEHRGSPVPRAGSGPRE